MIKSTIAKINVILMIAACAVIVILNYCYYRNQLKEYMQSRANYDEVKTLVITETPEGEKVIDFDILNTKTFDSLCSWIAIPGTIVDYPLVQANDNDTYLHIDAYGNDSTSGAIFLNAYNNANMNDPYNIIFGHSMKDGSMFHILHDYENEEYAAEHPTMYVYMKDGSFRTYQVLCVLSANTYDKEIYTVDPKKDNPRERAQELVEKADHVYSEVTDGRVIVLSTCVKDNNRRVVVFQEK